MFNKLQIRNFRKNEKLDADLEQITVLQGSNGKGKSSTIGAIKWVCFNSPSSDNYIHWNHDNAVVRLVDDKNTITRKRSKTENYYRLNKQKLKAMGVDVPEPIRNALNITELNFHRQQAGPFWFRETPGEVSRQLNAIVNLDLIDTTLSNLDRMKRANKAETTVVKNRIKEAKKQRKELRYIFNVNKKLKTLETKYETYQENIKKTQRLNSLIEEAKDLKRLAKIKIPNIKPLLLLHEKYKEDKKQYETLQMLFGKAEEYEEVIYQLENSIKAKQKQFNKLIGNRCPLCQQKIQS